MEKIWELIAKDLSHLFHIKNSASKWENRWKVLERNCRKVVDHYNKLGQVRKMFDYDEEFDEYNGKTEI